jgi:hypothetical protein
MEILIRKKRFQRNQQKIKNETDTNHTQSWINFSQNAKCTNPTRTIKSDHEPDMIFIYF